MIGQLTGGLGREARKEASPAAAFTGEELPPDKVPLVRWLYGNSGGASGQSERFHGRIRQASAADNEIKERVMEGVGVADYRTEHPGAIELAARGNLAERQVRALRRLRHDVVTGDGPDTAGRVRAVNQRRAAMMHGFNREA